MGRERLQPGAPRLHHGRRAAARGVRGPLGGRRRRRGGDDAASTTAAARRRGVLRATFQRAGPGVQRPRQLAREERGDGGWDGFRVVRDPKSCARLLGQLRRGGFRAAQPRRPASPRRGAARLQTARTDASGAAGHDVAAKRVAQWRRGDGDRVYHDGSHAQLDGSVGPPRSGKLGSANTRFGQFWGQSRCEQHSILAATRPRYTHRGAFTEQRRTVDVEFTSNGQFEGAQLKSILRWK
mmetsp:Transcript_13371/g.25666  ORF Transcript_13371/g.25666 Transcript_13371/m.25666 type:complete len:239 (-) Transcript_13371:246-962(-)